MTTIAFRDGSIAADSLVSDGANTSHAYATKIRKVKGHLLGACGELTACNAFLLKYDPKAIEDERYVPIHPNAGHKDNDDFEGIVVTPKGKIFIVSSSGVFAPVRSFGYIAIGSGAEVALGAMYAGADARTAIKAAIKHSFGTGGTIRTLSLDKKKKERS